MPETESADNMQLAALLQLGFTEPAARAALESTRNNLEQATDFLLKAMQSEEELLQTVERVTQLARSGAGAGNDATASTSQGASVSGSLIDAVLHKTKKEVEAYKAYKRLHADFQQNDQDYLDLPLQQEEQLLAEYRNLLEQ